MNVQARGEGRGLRSPSPALFSLATPVAVTGHFDDPKLNIRIWDVTKSAFRFVFSIVTTPIQGMDADSMSADSSEACIAEMRDLL